MHRTKSLILLIVVILVTSVVAPTLASAIVREAGPRPAPASIIPVSGTLTADTIWKPENTYVVDNLIVAPGVTLTIEPGTVVRVNREKAIAIQGTLRAIGTREAPILFTSNMDTPAPGDWGAFYNGNLGGLFFTETSEPATYDSSGAFVGGSIVRHAIIEYSKGVTLQAAAPLLDQNTVRYSDSQGAIFFNGYMNVSGKTPIISSNRILKNRGPALSVQQGKAIVRGNLIFGNVGGLFVAGEQDIQNNTIVANGGESCGLLQATICLAFSAPGTTFAGNNVYRNTAPYVLAMRFDSTQNVTFADNYWGVTTTAQIGQLIYDGVDGLGLGIVSFLPYRNGVSRDAPDIEEVFLPAVRR